NTFGVFIPDEPKITGRMGIIDHGLNISNNLNDPFTDYDGVIGIECRGKSTQQFPKKAYALETRDDTGANLDVSLLGMPPENDWILYAPYTDKSMLRNLVSFEMGHKMGNYCSRTVFCELVVNNDYKGIYIMMEKIKKDDNRVDIATLKPDEISGDDLTGGYIVKVDKLDPGFTYGVDGWKSNPVPSYPNAMNITFQYCYPEPDEIAAEQKTYIRDYITTAENILTGSSFTNPDNGYQQYFDVLSFVDFMILSEISKEVDKYRYSTYFYKEKDSDGGKLFAGPAWDFNLGYGNVDYWPPGIDYTGWLYPLIGPQEGNIMFWWKRLMEDSYFKNLAKTRWTWFRQHQLNNAAIHAVIDSVLTYTDAAKNRNYQRWPILGQYVWPNYNWYGNDYEDEVAYFENFLFNRLGWMDVNFPGTILHPWAGIAADSKKIKVLLYGDYFSRQELTKSNFRLNNAPEGVNILNVVYVNASECTIMLNANVSSLPAFSITVSEKVINYWEDITSNPLGATGISEPQTTLPGISLFEENHLLHIRCS
ncbi:MAG: CotH kinase family protein, partial [Bacteroidetes bacterium]|nr:CotH kinase family protein [Bacteroidota bacterium]